jgi:hypothetical protein
MNMKYIGKYGVRESFNHENLWLENETDFIFLEQNGKGYHVLYQNHDEHKDYPVLDYQSYTDDLHKALTGLFELVNLGNFCAPYNWDRIDNNCWPSGGWWSNWDYPPESCIGLSQSFCKSW